MLGFKRSASRALAMRARDRSRDSGSRLIAACDLRASSDMCSEITFSFVASFINRKFGIPRSPVRAFFRTGCGLGIAGLALSGFRLLEQFIELGAEFFEGAIAYLAILLRESPREFSSYRFEFDFGKISIYLLLHFD